MKVDQKELPERFACHETVWVPVSDGVRLAARLWLPDCAKDKPVPALMEMMPYRRRDFSRRRDDELHSWFAGHGYAVLRVDTRGTGDSEGLLDDEYLPREQLDAVDVLHWLGAQDWCDGHLGMMGLSWSGLLALQTAVRNPRGLKAVLAVGSTDDRFGDDVHYKGGQMLVDNPAWDATFLALSALPPDPQVVGPSWQSIWKARLEARAPWIETWAGHQERDDYWRQGSIGERAGEITCPVYIMGGTADGYIYPVFRLFETLQGPVKALIGPWPHVMPNDGYPGPAIGFLQEALMWWDYWLKGEENGIMAAPAGRAFVRDRQTPSRFVSDFEGGWIELDTWPCADCVEERLSLGHDLACGDTLASARLVVSSSPFVGEAAGKWAAGGGPFDLPDDQGADDARSLCFEGGDLTHDLVLIGPARVLLTLDGGTESGGQVVARLCEVADDGSSLLLSWGVTNLAESEGSVVEISLKSLAHCAKKGHRLRLALSSSYWPVVWPSAEMPEIAIQPETSFLDLSIWKGAEPGPAPFEEPLKVRSGGYELKRKGALEMTSRIDPQSGNWSLRSLSDYGGQWIGAAEAEIDLHREEHFQIEEADPASARYHSMAKYHYTQGDARVTVDCHYSFSSTPSTFNWDVHLTTTFGDKVFFQRHWTGKEPRTRS